MKLLREWWPFPVTWAWLTFITAVAGFAAAFFAGLTAIIIIVWLLWEVGRKERDQ